MGDRCFMHITCRRQDLDRFKELGFHSEYGCPPDDSVIELIDEEANDAHYEKLPTDIPYYGYHSAGGEYGAHDLACDGQVYVEVECGHRDGFIVQWDHANQQPDPASLERITSYLAVLASAKQQIEGVLV